MMYLRLFLIIKCSDTFQPLWQLSKFIQTYELQPELSNYRETFQLRSVLFNLARFFPTSLVSFQFIQKLFNFIVSNFTITLYNYKYPDFFISKWRNINRSNIGRTSITSWLDLDKIEIFTKLYLDFAMDSGKIGQNQGHHVIEHHWINKSRGDYFFEKFSFFWDSIWDMLL